jgi:hypothetical protein
VCLHRAHDQYAARLAVDDLIENRASALIWNRPSPPVLWFHYTTRDSARAIVATRTFKVGTTHGPDRSGVYVCPYMPGEVAEEDLAALILDGSYIRRERLQAAVVMAAGPDIAFTSDPDTKDGMRFLSPPGSLVPLPNQIVGWAAVVDGTWRHALTLFDPAVLT